MIKSMTGFGKTTVEVGNKKVIIEIKSLNSKQLDLNLRMPNLYKEKEMEVRGMVKEWLDRGKVDMCIYFDNSETDKEVQINRASWRSISIRCWKLPDRWERRPIKANCCKR